MAVLSIEPVAAHGALYRATRTFGVAALSVALGDTLQLREIAVEIATR
jgi:hypothetical protein